VQACSNRGPLVQFVDGNDNSTSLSIIVIMMLRIMLESISLVHLNEYVSFDDSLGSRMSRRALKDLNDILLS
jgi:hypothetical protein